MEQAYKVNIDANVIDEQYRTEKQTLIPKSQVGFDAKHYLEARLGEGELTKTLVIRLLPFDSNGGSPFKKLHVHMVKVNKNLSKSGWKQFICPVKNEEEGIKFGDKCPFCEISKEARQMKIDAKDKIIKDKYNEIEFSNRAREMWVVRCIERGNEQDGVKFWLFNSSRRGDGIYDKIMNIYNMRKEASLKTTQKSYNIFDLSEGKDLIITLSKTPDNKTTTQVMDAETRSSLCDNVEQGLAWINDSMKWYDVYKTKPFDYMDIVANNGIPVWNKELNKFVEKEENDKLVAESTQKEVEQNLQKPTINFETVVNDIEAEAKVNAKAAEKSVSAFPSVEPQAVEVASSEAMDDDLPF